jgi:hypothetical protein
LLNTLTKTELQSKFQKLCEGLLKLFTLLNSLRLGLTYKIYTISKISAETVNT